MNLQEIQVGPVKPAKLFMPQEMNAPQKHAFAPAKVAERVQVKK